MAVRLLDRVVPFTGWGFTDAVACMNCPRCLVVAGKPCRTPSGRKTWPPHAARSEALIETGYDANRRTAKKASDIFPKETA